MKILHIGDLHFGEKGNSESFNEQVLEFLRWAVATAKEQKCDYIIQHGDYFHSRHKIDVSTMNYGISGAEILAEFGADKVVVLEGNHDLYYLDRLDVSSVAAIRRIVRVVDKPTTLDDSDVFLIPWVANGEMWDLVVDSASTHKYLCAHLELNGFKVNDGYEMEHGFSHIGLRDYTRVITGHYHTMQTKDNITYLGTPYPITMSEANQDHGVYVLDTEEDTLDFVCYDKVKVLSMSLEDYLDQQDEIDPANTSIRIEFDDDLDDESLIDEVRDALNSRGFTEVKIKYTSKKVNDILNSSVDVVEVENIDQSVIMSIRGAKTVAGVNKDKLETLYNQAVLRGSES